MKFPVLLSCALLIVSADLLSAAEPMQFSGAFTQGKFSTNLRLRYENVAQSALQDANALTLRTRVGFATAPWQGLKAMIEAENILAADSDSYNQSGLNPGGAAHAVVADPETTELNQLFLAYSSGKTTGTLGRQRLVLDNARFIGDVGWRQNMQTFDAFVLQDKTIKDTTLTYAYLDQINRVFGHEHSQGKWESNSHLLNASYAGFNAGTITGYVYLLDFKHSSPANSCSTTGLSFVGATPLTDKVKFIYRAELATQSDYGASTLDYTATYAAFEGGLALKPGTLVLGYELLSSDHKVGFKTPLATLHAFDGWADLFLTTPAAGLQDTYVKATADLPEKIALVAFWHQFDSDIGNVRLGHEFDAQVSRKFGKFITGLAKYANFRHENTAYPNVQKFWTQIEFAY